jgi:hypothetical protein
MSDDVETPADTAPAAAGTPDTESAVAEVGSPRTGETAESEPVRAEAAVDADAGDEERDVPTQRRRGRILLHAVAFALVLLSGALVVVASLRKLDESGLSLLRASWWVSGAAILVAVASVLIPRRPS